MLLFCTPFVNRTNLATLNIPHQPSLQEENESESSPLYLRSLLRHHMINLECRRCHPRKTWGMCEPSFLCELHIRVFVIFAFRILNFIWCSLCDGFLCEGSAPSNRRWRWIKCQLWTAALPHLLSLFFYCVHFKKILETRGVGVQATETANFSWNTWIQNFNESSVMCVSHNNDMLATATLYA